MQIPTNIEIRPNTPEVLCVLASGLDEGAGDIEAGERKRHNVTVGPILPDRIADLIMGLRIFTGTEEWIEITFTTGPGSGVINETTTGP